MHTKACTRNSARAASLASGARGGGKGGWDGEEAGELTGEAGAVVDEEEGAAGAEPEDRAHRAMAAPGMARGAEETTGVALRSGF